MNSGSSSGCSTSMPAKWWPTPERRRVLRSTSKMQRRPNSASAIERRNQLLPVPAPPRTAITSRGRRGRGLKGVTLGFVVLLISLSLSLKAGSGLQRQKGGQLPCVFERSEEHTSELQSRFGISYAVFC